MARTKAKTTVVSRTEPKFWREMLQEVPLSKYIPFSSLISPSDVMLEGGDIMRTWRLVGISFETSDAPWIQECHEALSSLVRNLGGQFAIWTHRVHRYVTDELSPVESPLAAQAFDLAYRTKNKKHQFLATELYLSVIYRFKSTMPRMTKGERNPRKNEKALFDAIRTFEERSQMIERTLKAFEPSLLGEYMHGGQRYSELCEFLGFLVNGEWRRMRPPLGRLNVILPRARVFFGASKLEIRTEERTRFASIVDIKDYASLVEPGILDCLLYEPHEFIETMSFSALHMKHAVSALERQKKFLLASEDVVQKQIDAMDIAIEGVGDGQFSMGDFHYSLVVFGDDVDDAGKRAAQCVGTVAETGIELVTVDLIGEAAWFAQWPGNFAYRPRTAQLSSRAFVALAAQHNFFAGKREGNPWGEAIMICQTQSGQPYYLNLHASPEHEDSVDKKLPANTVIIGTTGVGKTTLEMAVLFQMCRFNPQPSFALLDFDRSCEIAIRALGGKYYILKSGESTGCNPLQREATKQRIEFWTKLVCQCIESPQLPLLPKDQAAIDAAVRTVARFPAATRCFSRILENLPKDGEHSLYNRFKKWCRGGQLGWVFDESDDMLLDIKSEHIIGFDYTQFIDNPEVRPVMLAYLLDVIGEMMDGRRIGLIIVEFWKALNDAITSPWIHQELKTIRKKSGFILAETQSPSDVLGVEIGRTVVEQSVTKIFMHNSDAVREEYMDGFGLSEAEYETVKVLNSAGQRRILVKQGNRSAICQMDLSGLDDHITLLSGSTDNIHLLEEIRAEVGEDPAVWIPLLLQRSKERDAKGKRVRLVVNG